MYRSAMCADVKRFSKMLRQAVRSIDSIFFTAATAWSMLLTIKPVRPSCMTSGTEPQLKAMVGVPQAMASIMVKPKGSGQSMGKR